jgi:hypothetical protein
VTFADIRLQRATSARARFEDERARELIEELRPEAELVTAGWPKRCATWLPRTRRGTAFQRSHRAARHLPNASVRYDAAGDYG